MAYSRWGILSAALFWLALGRLILIANNGRMMTPVEFFKPSAWLIAASVICYIIDRAVGGDWDSIIP